MSTRPARGGAFALAAVLSAGLLVGCGGGHDDAPQDAAADSLKKHECDLRLTKTVDGEHNPGSTATYSLVVDNMGSGPCKTPLTVTDELPPGVTFSQSSSPNWSCSVAGSTTPEVVQCTYTGGGALPSMTSTKIDLEVDIGDRACMSTNCAGVSNGKKGASADKPGFDDSPANNRSCADAKCTNADRCVNPPSGMVGWWTGDQTADDRSSENNHGALQNGAVYSTGQVAASFGLDGTDDHVKVPDDPSLNFGANGDFSIDAWIYPKKKQKDVHFIVDKRESAAQPPTGYAMQLRSKTLIVRLQTGTAGVTYSSSSQVPYNEWTHVTLTVDRANDQGVLYLNGAQDGTFSPSMTASGSISNGAPLLIGQRYSGGQNFKGRIDEVEIFNRALSAGEVQGLVDAGPCGKCRVECFDGEDTITAGKDDDFADGPDSASPSQYLQDNYGPLAEFDGSATNDHFGHTFSDLKPTLAHQYICGATLEIRMRARSGYPVNDAIRLSFSDGSGNQVGDAWWSHIGDDSNAFNSWSQSLLNQSWSNGAPAETFTLDLANLPASGSSSTNLMADLNTLAMLNVRVQDDTQVDWARLTIDYSCEACDFGDEQPDLAVDKTHEGELVVGQESSYTIAVENVGGAPADPETTITDEVPDCMKVVGVKAPWDQYCTVSGQTVTCQYPQVIQPGQQVTPIELAVVPTGKCGDKVENCASVSHDADDNADNDESCVGSEVIRPNHESDLSIDKKAEGGVFTQGKKGAWLFAVTNNGPGATQGPIVVSDTLPSCMSFDSAGPSPWSCSTGSNNTVTCTHPGPLAAGQSLNLTMTVQVHDNCGDKVRNCARVSAKGPKDPKPENDEDCADAEVQPPPTADLAIAKTHKGDLTYGEVNDYAITVKNNGSATAQGPITVTDALPKCMRFVSGGPSPWNCSLGSNNTVTCTHPGPLAAGQSLNLTLKAHVSRKCGDVATNCAKVTASSPADPDTSNNKSCDRSLVKAGQADLSVTKSHSGPIKIGALNTYDIKVTNHGPSAAQGPITVTDDLPKCMRFASAGPAPWSCTQSGTTVTCTHPGPLAAGQSSTLKLGVKTGHCGDIVNNCATVKSKTDPDPNTNNNRSCTKNRTTR